MTDTAARFSQFKKCIAIGFFFGIKGNAIDSGFNRLVFVMSKLHIHMFHGNNPCGLGRGGGVTWSKVPTDKSRSLS